jgi:hypothetical protein
MTTQEIYIISEENGEWCKIHAAYEDLQQALIASDYLRTYEGLKTIVEPLRVFVKEG